MEHDVYHHQQQQPMELPPGFRFHPTDEELITHYLAKKAADPSFAARAVGEADLNKCEPWYLPSRAKMAGKEWYFFCVKDRKYPTGLRTNRATEAGYWKATGKDKEIFRGDRCLVGMKKTLVFYTGRAPKGQKTNWVMHEYRLDGNFTIKSQWVLCRVFKKSSEAAVAGKKVVASTADELAPCPLPPLIDVSGVSAAASVTAGAHVTCFSNSLEGQFLNPSFLLPSPAPTAAQQSINATDHLAVPTASPFLAMASMQYVQEEGVGLDVVHGHGGLLESNWCKGGGERERLSGASQDTGLTLEVNPAEISSSDRPPLRQIDHEALWSY